MNTGDRPLLEAKGLTVHFGGLVAVDDVSLTVPAGGLIGLIGPNGAGKTTLLDALTGFARARGEVYFDGERIDRLPPHRRARRGLARTFQALELFEDLTVRENVLTAADPRLLSGLLEPIRGVPDRVAERADAALERVGLAPQRDCLPSELSNADRKLLGAARAMANTPRLVLLDEPAAGLDQASTAVLGERLRSLADRGTALVLVDHDMSLVLGVCDWVIVLDLGRILAEGTPGEVRGDADVIAAYLGEADPATKEISVTPSEGRP